MSIAVEYERFTLTAIIERKHIFLSFEGKCKFNLLLRPSGGNF
jgi:hypothetical protein